MANPAILTVDDDPAVSRAVARDIRRRYSERYRVVRATSGAEALDALREIKLRGDQVAVLRVGGKLAQVAEPAYLLAYPIDDFVAGFVGRDRGYRALGFYETPDLQLTADEVQALEAPYTPHGPSWF